jgi:ribosome biogenesis GTPase
MTPLRAIGWPWPGPTHDSTGLDPAWRELIAAHPQARPARVVEQHRSGYIVAEGPGDGFATESPPEWQRPPSYRKGNTAAEARAAVGDWVLVEDAADADNTPSKSTPSKSMSSTSAPSRSTLSKSTIVAMLPRYSAIKRAAAGEHYKQQVIAANVDVVFVVCGLDADFNPRRIERYLLLVQGSGATPVVVLTKADKCDDVAGAVAELDDIAAQGVAVVALNAKDPDRVAALGQWLREGNTAVLVGSSGAGKSTLTNSLLGSERMKTAAVRASDERGRHTTTHRALIPLPSGACLIDTPGMRELKPTGEEAVVESFADIEALAEQCRFRDCKHEREPGCAVRAAIETGTLAADRYAHFLKLRDEVAGAASKLATRRAQATDDKTSSKTLQQRTNDKYGRHDD